jgi:Transposase DDE domain
VDTLPSFADQYFPSMPCYEQFVTVQKRACVPLTFSLLSHMGKQTGIYCIDSTSLPVCDNHRIHRHKTFAGLAARAKPRWAGSLASLCQEDAKASCRMRDEGGPFGAAV